MLKDLWETVMKQPVVFKSESLWFGNVGWSCYCARSVIRVMSGESRGISMWEGRGPWLHAFEVKSQSNRSSRGLVCLFVHVYLQPLSGNSSNLKLLMASSLKANISWKFPPGLFLSSGLLIRIRLKSPTMSHLLSSGIAIPLNHCRKSIFLSEVHGAKILVRNHSSPVNLQLKCADWAYWFWNIVFAANLILFHTVMDPLDAPTEGKNMNSFIWGGQNFLTYASSKNSLLVSCKHRMSHLDSRILVLMASHFPSEFIPLMFQDKITQFLLQFVWFMISKLEKTETTGGKLQPIKNFPHEYRNFLGKASLSLITPKR